MSTSQKNITPSGPPGLSLVDALAILADSRAKTGIQVDCGTLPADRGRAGAVGELPAEEIRETESSVSPLLLPGPSGQ